MPMVDMIPREQERGRERRGREGERKREGQRDDTFGNVSILICLSLSCFVNSRLYVGKFHEAAEARYLLKEAVSDKSRLETENRELQVSTCLSGL